MPVTRNTPNKAGWGKKTTQSVADDAQAGDQLVEPTNNTAQADEQLAPAEAGTAQPSTSGTQPNDQMAQMLLMMQKTFYEQSFLKQSALHSWNITLAGTACGRLLHLLEDLFGLPESEMSKWEGARLKSSTYATEPETAKEKAATVTESMRTAKNIRIHSYHPLEKVPKIDWTHNDGLHSHYTILERTVECKSSKVTIYLHQML